MGSRRPTRRQLLVGGGVVLGLGGIEAASLTGAFDFRRAAPPTSADAWRASLAALAGKGEGAIVHVGHSTHLISVAGTRFLTDPWFHDPAFGALAHRVGPAVGPAETGRLDAILVSHAHPDHLDPKAMRALDRSATVLVDAERTRAMVRSLGFEKVRVLAEWETVEIGAATVTAVPAVHDCHEVGYVVRGAGRSVYFAGDTLLHPGLDRVARELAPTYAILPVDGTKLLGKVWVMTPDDAAEAARRLGVRAAMPTHAEAYFTDPLVSVAMAAQVEHAPERFAEAIAKRAPGVGCDLPPPGGLVEVPRS